MEPENTSQPEEPFQADDTADDEKRRAFLAKAAAGASCACVALPIVAALPAALDPARPSEEGNDQVPWSKVAPLAALPEGGTPAKFGIVRERVTDAWTTLANVPVGAVYLMRDGDSAKAFNLKCPHLGCAIDYRGEQGDFFCPCHNSAFALDGSVSSDSSPSPRGMDDLELKVEDGYVWVRFQHFRPNVAEKIPLS